MAVPPDLVGFVESAGLAAVPFTMHSQTLIRPYLNYWTSRYSNFWEVRHRFRLSREVQETGSRALAETSTALMSLTDGADLLLTGVNFEHPAAHVAEHYDIPLATMHFCPVRANGQDFPALAAVFGRSVSRAREWLMWLIGTKKIEDAQRRELGLPKANGPLSVRMAQRGSLEIQAYDEICFPGLATEWAKSGGRRPFVGNLTIELPTEADEDVSAWIAAGTPPICFGFGSMKVDSIAETVMMIAAACARLGERALICAGVSELDDVSDFGHVKVVPAVNYAEIFPTCRAVVHHGTSATAAGLRAGVPTLILWKIPEQRLWGNTIKRLKVGTARSFFATTEKSLVTDLSSILETKSVNRAREIAAQMTKPADCATYAADLVEQLARVGRAD
jgi:UDP:flavonoid glycosyltransferase YjiC (YdhE family)